jgi:glyoxylase-like metal-dependent hydrolase (beta-lactamase superfamily II)
MSKRWAAAALLLAIVAPATGRAQDYEILAARYATIAEFPLRSLIPDAPSGEALDIAMAIWIVRGGGRTIVFDTGFFREEWLSRFDVREYERPDRVLERIGIAPGEVTDVIVSHAHWDHMGGLPLFANATIWIQKAEYDYYTGEAWQEGGRSGGIDRADILHLVERNTTGSVRLVDGDSVEMIPGVTVYTGARHTFASQYISVNVDGAERYVLASDNAYLYRNITESRPSATFMPDDREANLAAVRRMVALAGDASRVVPGHDAEVFRRHPTLVHGVVRITAASRESDGIAGGIGPGG